MTQKRRRVYAVSILDKNSEKIISNKLNDLVIKLIKEKNYKTKEQKINEILDFDNIDKQESIWAQIKNTTSRIRMIESSPIYLKNNLNNEKIFNQNIKINPKKIIYSKENKTPTITTKQDRLPNVGILWFENKWFDKNKIPYTNFRFIQPKESYKLMGFDEEDYLRAKKSIINAVQNSNRIETATRDIIWKQAGNGQWMWC